MTLIAKKDIINAGRLSRFGILQWPLASLAMHFTGINKVNRLYSKLKDKKGAAFFERFVEELDLHYLTFEEDLARIPKTGAFVVVANHPLGAADGVLMAKILSEVRPDFKLMANFLLSKIEPLEPYIIPVNPFEGRREAFNSFSGMKAALQHLQNGGCLGVFPAGEVSNRSFAFNEIRDKPWELPVLKLIKKAGVPVIPMYFHARNSAKFYSLGRLHPDLQTLLLPSEMLKKRDKPIRIRIGRPISAKVQNEYDTAQEFGEFLRSRVYLMKSYFDKRKSVAALLKLPNLALNFSFKNRHVFQNIIDETPVENLVKEIEELRSKEGKKLFGNGNYEMFFAEYAEIPFLMREIGRQRELAFREIGEGTNMPFDLDAFDQNYHHLFLWDSASRKLVGAYRLGLGRELMERFGILGFYTSSLFEFGDELKPLFGETIEMGRAFVTKEYQQKPLPLFLLWQGILHVCFRNPHYQYLMGPVSLSNRFSDFSKSIIIEFMRSHYFDSAFAQYVRPKNEFKVRLKEKERENYLKDVKADLGKLDQLIDSLEPQHRLPVLLKKYIKQNAKVVAFNVDPGFNDAIDGLMYIKISDLPENTIKPVLEEMQKSLNVEN